MKTRKGKRFLSVLLAAIMVLTALPLTALAEGPTPAKSDALITLDNAINAYESAMDGKIYADMATATTSIWPPNKRGICMSMAATRPRI